eukprot:12401255-Karenia_brevis.AAC.1
MLMDQPCTAGAGWLGKTNEAYEFFHQTDLTPKNCKQSPQNAEHCASSSLTTLKQQVPTQLVNWNIM